MARTGQWINYMINVIRLFYVYYMFRTVRLVSISQGAINCP
jgi:hypothetical protein